MKDETKKLPDVTYREFLLAKTFVQLVAEHPTVDGAVLADRAIALADALIARMGEGSTSLPPRGP